MTSLVLLDYETNQIVDVLHSRHKSVLSNYFTFIPAEERNNVKVLATDTWDSYRRVAKIYLKNYSVAPDHYHIKAELSKKIQNIRIRAMKSCNQKCLALKKRQDSGEELTPDEKQQLKDYDVSYYLLKKFCWKLTKYGADPLFDQSAEYKFNKKLNRYINYHGIRKMILEMDDELANAFDLVFSFDYFLRKARYEDAPEKLEELINDFQYSGIEEMEEFARYLKKWRTEIINSFIVIGKRRNRKTGEIIDIKISNAKIEHMNSRIKLIKRSSNGYLNWRRLRNRILYSCNKGSTYSVYPHNPEKEKKEKDALYRKEMKAALEGRPKTDDDTDV